MKITRFDLLRGPFIYGDQASRWVPKIKQNVANMHQKSSRNEHEKIWIPVSQWSKRTPSTDLRKCIETRSFFVVPGVALLTPCMQKSLKIVENSSQNDHKKYESRCCNDQKHTPSTDLRKCSETRSFLSFPVLLCSRHACRIRSKSSKIIDGGM